MNSQRVALIISLLFLSACAMPAGTFKEKDLAWTKITIPLNYQAVYGKINNGFMSCGNKFVKRFIYPDINEAKFVTYLQDAYGRKTNFFFGRTVIKAIDENSSFVSIGVNKTYDWRNSGKSRKIIERWANGILSHSCP